MTAEIWETVPLRGTGVALAWRKPGGAGAGPALVITISAEVAIAMGLDPSHRIVPQRNRMAGQLRLVVCEGKPPGARRPAWKHTKHVRVPTIFVPMLDVQATLRGTKPREAARFQVAPGVLTISLPAWACPPVQISRPAIPLRDAGHAR